MNLWGLGQNAMIWLLNICHWPLCLKLHLMVVFRKVVETSRGRLSWRKWIIGEMNVVVILVPSHFLFLYWHAFALPWYVLSKYMGPVNHGLKSLRLWAKINLSSFSNHCRYFSCRDMKSNKDNIQWMWANITTCDPFLFFYNKILFVNQDPIKMSSLQMVCFL